MARVWWLCGRSTGTNTVYPGDSIYVHGEGFSAPAYAYLNGPAGQSWVAVAAIKPGCLTVARPPLPPGTYELEIFQEQCLAAGTVQLAARPEPKTLFLPPPTGGDDVPMIQSFIAMLPQDGSGGALRLDYGTYLLGSTLTLLAGYGGPVTLMGQGEHKTMLRPTINFQPTGDGVIQGGALQELAFDSTGTRTSNGRTLRVTRLVDCDITTDPAEGSVFADGGDLAHVFILGCSFTGQGLFFNQPVSCYIDYVTFFLDGPTEAVINLWNSQRVRLANVNVRDRCKPGRGRAVVLGLASADVYMEKVQTFNLAGTPEDSNCGEQILFEGNPGDTAKRVYIYDSKLQGRKDMVEGASTSIETWGVTASDFYVDTLECRDLVWGLTAIGPQAASYKNIKIRDCRKALRLQGDLKGTTLQNVVAKGTVEHSIEMMGPDGPRLIGSELTDAPIGIHGDGNVVLEDSHVLLGAGKFAGSKGLDATGSLRVDLQGNSSVAGFETGNLP